MKGMFVTACLDLRLLYSDPNHSLDSYGKTEYRVALHLHAYYEASDDQDEGGGVFIGSLAGTCTYDDDGLPGNGME
jgi:hypothetical protein